MTRKELSLFVACKPDECGGYNSTYLKLQCEYCQCLVTRPDTFFQIVKKDSNHAMLCQPCYELWKSISKPMELAETLMEE